MIFTILSFFDNLIGPRVFFKTPKLARSSIQVENIPLLMDLYKTGFFIHHFGGLKTANLVFDISSPRARGSRDNIMITLVSREEEFSINLESFQEIMEYFAHRFQIIKNIYKGFYYDSKMPGSQEKYGEIVDLLLSLQDFLPSDQEIYTQKVARMFTY